ncbi:glycogen debranching protein GlgX [Erwinia psidii]|uniref:glycogen debranching protein GlgX n=1 Tax=Erwinia psidii TaxID=69224 RepID=UPI00226B4138|nr:glycogen debranching protein GlgX [Erwinia psidii]MCX8958842.1 glycogen debranching protein GlgX [Erwinia psidii]MCX8961913.1 glycogen debranching protein GlgX [Erwinia psidii]
MSQIQTGQASPAGAFYDGHGVNFTLFSPHADRVELCLFDAQGEERRMDLPACTEGVWHGWLAAIKPGQRYGYRVHGPWQPHDGHRFNPAKLLVDPCARAVEGEVTDDPRFQCGETEPDTSDSGPVAPRSVVLADDFDWEDDQPPCVPWGQTVIYEAHVRGLTQRHPDIPPAIRGTYAALGHPVMINYFKRLGITSLELLPVACFAHEPRLLRLGLTNYWGYNPLAPYALHNRYASGIGGTSARAEFQQAVKALHKAGIEVILDVVFNHSAELEETGPTLMNRGVDNKSYYWLSQHGGYENWTGCGNTLNLSNPVAMRWTLDCLRYWVETCHVDGFRFDLATVLGRAPEYYRDSALFQAIEADPLLSHCKMIAEPWDIGPGGYQVGNFPARFAEWNDQFRDVMRRYWLHGDMANGEFARCFAATSDVFQQQGRLPSASINLITAHDGFTLRDLVSFNHKHNEANGEDNRDGHNSNFSHNHGVEGLNAPLLVTEHRRRSVHALLTTLLLAQGTPMLLAGDEHGHSQHGNNNAYCQDNELTWLDWQHNDSGLFAFTAALIALRKTIPALTADRWWQEGDGNVEWLDQAGQALDHAAWQHGVRRLQIRLSQHWLIAINATEDVSDLTLPPGEWHAIPPFAGDDNPILVTVWHGPAHGVCVFRQQ